MNSPSSSVPPRGQRAARARAIAYVTGSAGLFALAAAAVKALQGALPLSEVVLFRNLLALPAILLLAQWSAPGGLRGALRTRHPRRHAERLIGGLIGMYGSFYGYVHLPLATVTALNFTMPLFLTALSVLLLRERVGWRRLAVVLAGFGGVLLMLQPGGGGETLHLGAVAGVLAAALGWAYAMVSIRKMGELGESGITIVLWFAIGAAAVAAVATLRVWITPTPRQWGLLLIVGLVSVGAQMLMTAAYRSADATVIAPFEYSAILWTTVLGVLLWGEVPDMWDLAGFLVLVGAGLAIWRMEVAGAPR
ncbi:DMT family transporter [Roseomonas sp. SSH11]|uniref:DMT family transporter n=1 Tax=Pararoseomonas baculiformis TaxID=2820812 RepID=A0ABS4AF62_9PROT|nr:DMT family transporter [Pararoseomonas baculiformis]MBP0445655.1 DMT family transporter [Pararoseomonas baculiformis]